MHHEHLQFQGLLFIVIMGDGVAIALNYYSDIRLSKCTLISRTGGEEDYDTKSNSFA